MSKIRVIFDRSAFHGERFDALQGGALVRRIKEGRIEVFHTAIMLEETISMYLKEKNRDELRKQLPFILGIGNGKWFLSPQDLWHEELVRGRGPKTNPYLPKKDRVRAETTLRDLVFRDITYDNFESALAEKNVERIKQGNPKRIYRELREDIGKQRRTFPQFNKASPPPFERFCRGTIDDWGRTIIQKHVRGGNTNAICDTWSRDKSRYRFFTSWTEGMLYAGYYAMLEANKPIDSNAQVDIDQLCYLNAVDVLVTCDLKFMKSAFDVLWKPKGRVLFTTDEFVRYLA